MYNNYEIWNKKDDIKGKDANYWFENYPEFIEGDVILFKDNLGIVRYVESINTLKYNYNIDIKLNTNDAIKKYVDLIEEKRNIEKLTYEKLIEGLQAVLRGDMQELAYILYPKDFKNINVLNMNK